ncbi:hypothetical protein [Bosea psychrotolerans]|uniref:hypothetical protein n=1 Tax=Bosea psychrotolerans TaxID=1871628 RepID=UPI0011B0436F|nr:hypothetical protein [Bosea psychrotolerans]
MLISAFLALCAYIFMALLLFGGIFAPVGFLTIWSGRLGPGYWPWLMALALAISSSVYLPPLRERIGRHFRAPLFIASSMAFSVLLVGAYADARRQKSIAAFSPTHVLQHSFFRSIRSAPQEFQFYLHAAALKDCTPYAWSYREMAFYVLKPSVAVNVLPWAWLEMCSIRRP